MHPDLLAAVPEELAVGGSAPPVTSLSGGVSARSGDQIKVWEGSYSGF